MKLSEFNNLVRLDEESHRYFRNSDNQELRSVSMVLDLIKEPFDAKAISARMTNSPEEALILQGEWDQKRDNASGWGNLCHGQCENFIKDGKITNSSFEPLVPQLQKILSYYKKNFSEYILHDNHRLIAGTADHIGMRNTLGKYYIVDVNDFKSNIEKGIMNFSGKKDDLGNLVKYYNKYLLHPLEHLQDCNYIIYCLQLSIYALMLETLYDKIKIGALNIFFIDKNLKITVMPVPYMRQEAMLVMDLFTTKKDLKGNFIYEKLQKGNEFNAIEEPILHGNGNSVSSDPDDDEWV